MTVAVECIEDRFYYGLFGAVCGELRSSYGADVELVVVRSINGAVGNGWQQRLARSGVVSVLMSNQWVRALQGMATRVAYRSASPGPPVRGILDWVRSAAVWREERNRSDCSNLRVLDVPVGDLVIDSYLRYRPSPRFDPGDPFVRRLIWQAYRDVRKARAYFRKRRPRFYLTSYATYLEHGIATRVALQEGIRVLSFGNFQDVGKELSVGDALHTANTSAYSSTFESLEGQAARLAEAEEALRVRLSGGVDAATSYMKVSAYSAKAGAVPDVSDAFVVFLHDFYDSPHVYHDFIFPDFWAWICFTLDTLLRAGRKVFVKPHPNQIALSSEVLHELVAKYPRIPLVPPTVTNVQLAESGMKCGITVYGTVGHELAYLGVSSITCARHPHHAFGFCRNASTIEQYERLLLDPVEMPLSKGEMRRQALAFYYMHNLHGDAGQLALRAHFVSFWTACHGPDTPDFRLAEQFRALRDLPAFREFVRKLVATPLNRREHDEGHAHLALR